MDSWTDLIFTTGKEYFMVYSNFDVYIHVN